MGSDDSASVSALRATAHPVRLRILSLLTASALSAAEIARELDLTHANASYHLRVLADAGEVVEAGEEKIRGGVAKRYRHHWDRYRSTDGPRAHPGRGPAAGSAAGPRAGSGNVSRGGSPEADGYVRAMADELVRRFAARAVDSRAWMADAEMWVTPQVWQQVVALVEEASRLVHTEARPPRAAGTVHVNLTAAAFQLSADPSPIQPDSRRVVPEVTGR